MHLSAGTRPWALTVWSHISQVATVGGAFNTIDPHTIQERLRQAPGEQARQEVAPVPDKPGPAPTRWTLRTIRASIATVGDYSLSGVWRMLQRCKCGVRTPLVRRFSPDAEYASKEAHLLDCLRSVATQPDRQTLVFIDEMGYYRWPTAVADWDVCSSDLPAPKVERAGNNTQWRMVGGLNALTGQVTYLDNYIVGRQQLITFYGRLVQTYPDVERLYVVQDNWSIHTHPDVTQALSAWPQIEPVWLPTYAPWLNPIEKLWRWLRQSLLHRHRSVEDWKGLREQVRAFMEQFASGSAALLRYVGLLGDGKLANALYER